MTAIKRGNLFALLFFCYSKKPYLTDLPFVRGSTKGKNVLPYRTKNATHTLSHTQKYMLPNITPKISSPPSLIDDRRASLVPHQKRRTFPKLHTKKPAAFYRPTQKSPPVFRGRLSAIYLRISTPKADIRKSLLSGVELDNQVRFHHRGIRYIVKLRYKRVLCRQLRRINFQIRREVACLRLDSRHNDSQLL